MGHRHQLAKRVHFLQKAASFVLLFAFLFEPFAAFAQTASDSSQTAPANSATQTQTTASQPATPDSSSGQLVIPLDVPVSSSNTTTSGTTGTNSTDTTSATTQTSPAPDTTTGNIDTTANQSQTSTAPQTTSPNLVVQSALSPSAPGSGAESPDLTRKAIDPKFYSQPDPVTGSLDYTFPIQIPPGRNNMQPNVDLKYSSQPGSDANVMGYGWDPGIPYIERINKQGTDSLYTQNYFYSSIDGEIYQTAASSSTWGARVESGTFNNYQLQGTSSSTYYWTMTDKNGLTYTFGTTTTTRLDNPTNAGQVYKWMLEKVQDPNGNYITYQYTKDSGEIYPSKVLYTSNASSTGIFEIDYSIATRNDPRTSNAYGFSVTSNYQISAVQIKVNGVITRTYTLSYTQGVNNVRSLLSSITETAYTNGVAQSFPPSQFTYRSSNKNWTNSSTYTAPIPFDASTYLADINGDGLVDIVHSLQDTASNTAYINTGSGWTASSTWSPPVYFWSSNSDQGARFVDVNGDGLEDIVVASTTATSSDKTYINTGSGWTASSTWNSPVQISGTSSGAYINDLGVRFVDLNGDGLTDILQAHDGVRSVWINTGHGWTQDSNWSIPVDFTIGGGDNYVRVEDVNGDGLPDLVQSTGTTRNVWINTGTGFTLDTSWYIPLSFGDSSNPDQGVRFADLTGNGLPDIIQSWETSNGGSGYTVYQGVYMNTGHGWTYDSTWSIPTYFSSGAASPADDEVRFADVNGDGMLDLIQSQASSTVATYLNNSQTADLLATVTYPQGGITSYTYQPTEAYKDASGNPLNPNLPQSLNTVSSISLNNRLGAIALTTYSYQGGKYYYGDPLNRWFAGFKKVVKTDSAGNVTNTYYDQGDGSASSTGEYQDDTSKIGKVYRTESYDNSSHLYKKNIYWWNKTALSGNRNFISLLQEVDSTYDGTGSHKDTATSYTYDSTGNPLTKITWGQVTGNDDGSFTAGSGPKYTTTMTYASSTSGYPTLIDESSTVDQSSNKVNEQINYYDNSPLGTVTLGNLTKQLNWISGSTYASTTYTYNSYGLLTAQKDPDGNQTTYSYDTNNLYPATTTNALSQTISATYDYNSGQVATTTDTNGNVFANTYDGFGRLLTQSQPDVTSSGTPQVIATQYQYQDSVFPVISKTTALSPSTYSTTYAYFDGFGRIAQTRQAVGTSTGLLQDGGAPVVIPPVSALVVGGGGAGGNNGSGGGGGAGGFQYINSLTLTPGAYPITVGAGGTSSTTQKNGWNSSIGTVVVSLGGGGGGTANSAGSNAGAAGGSGGGSGSGTGGSNTGGTGTTGQGYAGANSPGGNTYAGGGGGAGAVATSSYGAPGLSSNITGVTTYYAGGGGGGYGTNNTTYAGGIGGGGQGGDGGNNTAGAANTGGGGGGGDTGAAGGSGIVVISYPTDAAINFVCNGTATTTGLNTACIYTSSGTFNVNGTDVSSSTLSASYLIVAGGGGSGDGYGGGGGAGGVLTGTVGVLSTSYPIIVGAGGVGVASHSGTAGQNSSAFGFTATGGGYGSNASIYGGGAGGSGGSGGGGGGYSSPGNSGGSGINGEGYGGGQGYTPGGGGGGAGGSGQAGNVGTPAGAGGPGISSSITGTTTTYGVGGGGGAFTPTAGAANTGNGGTGNGSNGGSGVVIVSFPTTFASLVNCGSATVTTTGTSTVCTYTASSTFTYTASSTSSSGESSTSTEPTTSDYIVRDYAYNDLGLLGQESLPYFDNGSASSSPTTNVKLYSVYTYDPMLRVKSITNAEGSTTYTYNNWVTTVTDANNNAKDLTYDAYGNLVEVTEHNNGSSYNTYYTYDGNKDLTQLTDANGNVRNFTYDGLGDELTSQDLHATTDSNYGTWTYTYDPAQNKLTTGDPNGNNVTDTYDALNRLHTEKLSGITEKTYTYDSCTNGIGHVCSVASPSATTTYTYDPLGNTTEEVDSIAGSSAYTTQYTHDDQGNVLTQTYPDSSVVTYVYDGLSHLKDITETEVGSSTPQTIVQDIEYGPDGQITYQKNGNGTETFNTYDLNNLYRLTTRKTTGPGLGISQLQALYATSTQLTPMLMMGGGLEASSSQPIDYSKASISNPIEVPEWRTNTSRTYAVGKDGQGRPMFKTQLYPGQINEQNPDGTYSPVNTTIAASNTATGVAITAGTYSATVSNSILPTLFTFTNASDTLSVDLADSKENSSTKTPTKSTSTEGTVYTYKNALGTGTNLELVIAPEHLRKNIVLTKLPSMPTNVASSTYDVTFKLTSQQGIDLSVDGQLLSKVGSITSAGAAKLTDSSGTIVAYIYPPTAKDSSAPNPNSITQVPVTYTLQTDGIYLTKHIPYTWLQNATYPVRADITLSTNAGSGDGWVQSQPYPSSWETQHSDTVGRNANYTDNNMWVYSQVYDTTNGYLAFDRGFLPFNTTSLPTNAIIGTTTLNVYAIATSTAVSDGYNSINVYQGFQNATSSIINSDINKCGNAVTNPAKGSTDTLVTNIFINQYHSFFLNASGTSWINPGGWTKLCLREGNDAADQLISSSGGSWQQSGAEFATNEIASETPYLQIDYTLAATSTPPGTPDQLMVDDQTNPENLIDQNPSFTARYNNPGMTDPAVSYQIQVSSTTSFTGSLVWDSGEQSLSASTSPGYQTPNIPYTGTAFPLNSQTYYWRIRLWDSNSTAGNWSTATSTFTMADNESLEQQYSYTYDPVGNITQIVDTANGSKTYTSNFTYDNLYRLTNWTNVVSTATTTATTTESLSYDSLGNILSKSDVGTYSYTKSGYSDPDAVTSIGTGTATTTIAYDHNGNLTIESSPTRSVSNTWNYLNHLTQSSIGTTSPTVISYAYNASGNRVKYATASSTTYYPNAAYTLTKPSTGTTTIEKDIYANGTLVAMVSNQGGATSTYWEHPDYLGSSNIVTNTSGLPVENTKYYPFGTVLADATNSGFAENRKYIGQQYDVSSGYNYLNARYESPNTGRFISEDPIFVQSPSSQSFTNPQDLNSYTYSGDNPIRYKDPLGRDYVDYNVSGAAELGPEEPIPVGPSFSVYNVQGQNNEDPFEFVGINVSQEPGVSAAATGGKGTPTEGFNISVSGFGPKQFAGGASYGCTIGQEFNCGPEGGVGTKGLSVQVGVVAHQSEIANFISGGPLQYQTTPMTAPNIRSSTQASSLQIPINIGPVNTYNSYTTYSSPSYSSASYYLNQASAAISNGNYSAAINYLSSASKALNGK